MRTRGIDETRHDTLPDLLREQVAARPDAPAVVHDDVTLTYRELAAGSAGLATCLRRLGVAPDDCVGLYVEPSVDLMVGAWGILHAGGAYLPLSPEYPEERLRYMIEESRATVFFCQPKLAARLAALAPADSAIVTMRDVVSHGMEPAVAGPRDLAYVIYTSGSTGKPKGVMIEHRSVVNQLRWLRDSYRLGPETVVLQKTPMSFDAAQWEILAPACGATVVMGDPGVYRDPERLVETITAHRVTALQCVPTLLQALLDVDEITGCTSLTQIFSGGEALSRNLAQHCLRTLPWCELVNLYGPTECTINSSALTVDPRTVAEGPQAVSIGVPVRDTSYHILDAGRAPVAVGEVGELYIGGVQVARGYLHRPDLTAERFVPNPFGAGVLFRTGDLASWNTDGTVQFAGRTDNQVKLRGFRVELDEIRLAIETHDWVQNAAVIVEDDSRTGFQNVVAFVELDPKEAALMDQGNHGAHHQSKASKLQVRAQLSNPGCRRDAELAGLPVVDLPGAVPTAAQRRLAFARKTYRFYEGGEVGRADILRLLARRPAGGEPRGVAELDLSELGEILRNFGQYLTDERLLPKYAYASPGSLYATQLYVELSGVAGIAPGTYYYHPLRHQLVLISTTAPAGAAISLHFLGKRSAIELVYRNNIQEVLEIETGHMVGLFEHVLPSYGLDIRPAGFAPGVRDALRGAPDDYHLASFEIHPYDGRPDEAVDVYVQSHPGRIADLPAGQYRYTGTELEKVSGELVLKKHVIAINQQVYERSSFGITVFSRNPDPRLAYVDLGRKLQHYQQNDLGIGLMSSGYSSKSGNDLPSAKRMRAILGRDAGPSYFFVGGRVSAEQQLSEGMHEDVVHMRGPTEMIRDDLATFLPAYMVPNTVTVLDRLPLTANGKIDTRALAELRAAEGPVERPVVAPRTPTEERVRDIWAKALRRDVVSVRDDFFESGGNSLVAVALINRIKREFGTALPLQVLFEYPRIEVLASAIDRGDAAPANRLVPLEPNGAGAPVYCWPGLGGYTMNLRLLAGRLDVGRPFHGVLAYGINEGETPYPTISAMAAADVELIRAQQPDGPYTLWGYSFGARVAFEAAYQLEQTGERVRDLFLIAPGSPRLDIEHAGAAGYGNPAYLTILFSVFAGGITDPALDDCLRQVTDEDGFVAFIRKRVRNLEAGLIRRIVRIVRETYSFQYTFRELAERRISAPITIFKASGDDYSFIENSSGYSAKAPVVVKLQADHYSLLKYPDVDELAETIRRRLWADELQHLEPVIAATVNEGDRHATRQHQAFPRLDDRG